jgi:hypothetical protein
MATKITVTKFLFFVHQIYWPEGILPFELKANILRLFCTISARAMHKNYKTRVGGRRSGKSELVKLYLKLHMYQHYKLNTFIEDVKKVYIYI